MKTKRAKFKDQALQTLRERRGLEPEDSSQDEQIQKMTEKKALEEILAWHLGSRGWLDQIELWAGRCGLKIVKRRSP
jgi:hypothetical protein